MAGTDGRFGRLATCTSCGAPIRWAVTKNGKRMPVDATPSSDGNVVLIPRLRGEAPEAHVYRDPTDAAAGAPDGDTYLSHFSTCPNARAHRR